mgnify:CR=1 FL=1
MGIKIPPSGERDRRGGRKVDKMNPIIIKTYPVPESKCELVRLQKDANKIITELQRGSGLQKSFLVSEIIRQVAPYVEFQLEALHEDSES